MDGRRYATRQSPPFACHALAGANAVGREDAIDLVAELEDTQERLRRLIAELRRVAEAEAG